MPNDEKFRTYVEALTELSDLDNKHRSALRCAVEASAAADDRAKARLADQQRMYDRAKRDALDAERALTGVRSMLNLPQGAAPTGTPVARAVRPLAQIRAEIAEVARWASESKLTAESLMRTRERLAKAPKPAEPKLSPAPEIQAQSARRHPISAGVAVAIIAAIATVVLIVFLVAQ